MFKKTVLQCLLLLVLLESSMFLLFRGFNQSEFVGFSSTFCGKCRISIKVDINQTDVDKVKHSEAMTWLSLGNVNSFVTNVSQDTGQAIIVRLKDIQRSVKNVFFIESSCGTRKLERVLDKNSNYLLSARQSCAVESTARNNPARDIYIVHSCPLSADFLSRAPEYARKLLQLRNVRVVKVNLTELFQDSPVQGLFKSGRLDDSYWPVVHASDVIRILLLWKFGGTYCDLDTINIRPLDQLGTNFGGFQDRTINNAFLNFEPDGFGHYVCTRILQHFERYFDGTGWATNGPFVITQVIIDEECKVPPVVESDCNIFTVYDRSVLYPVFFPQFKRLFDSSSSEELIKSFKVTAFSIHFWNKQSKNVMVDVGSNQTYGLLADEFCPSVYRNCGSKF